MRKLFLFVLLPLAAQAGPPPSVTRFADPRAPTLIVTERGAGYVFKAAVDVVRD